MDSFMVVAEGIDLGYCWLTMLAKNEQRNSKREGE